MKFRKVVAIAVAPLLTLSACTGGKGNGLAIGGQKVNNPADTLTVAKNALAEFSDITGANVDHAECYTRIRTDTVTIDNKTKTDRYPVEVDCLGVGFLGDSDFDMVVFPISVGTDPDRPKELSATVETEFPAPGTFRLGDDAFDPPLPDKLPAAGTASPPQGTIIIDDQLVRTADLDTASEDGIAAMKDSERHTAEDKLTLSDDPACLFTADLKQMWCGPALSLPIPEGEVFGVPVTVPTLDLATYVGWDQWKTAEVILDQGSWYPVGEEPGSLVDTSGQPAELPAASSIEAPELPTIPSGIFVDRTDEGQFSYDECVNVGRDEQMCDQAALDRLDSMPSILAYTSGALSITALHIAQSTGNYSGSNITDAEQAAPGEHLIAISAQLQRNDDVVDTEPLNAQLLIGDVVKADWAGVATDKSFFMSVPDDGEVRLRLLSGGETQDLVITGETVTRSTTRPEIYVEPTTYTFSEDQTWVTPTGYSESMRVDSNPVTTQPWIVVDKRPVVPPAGTVMLPLDITFRLYSEPEIVDCVVKLNLADGSKVDPIPVNGRTCGSTYGGITVVFAVAPGAPITSVEFAAFQHGDTAVPAGSIPVVPG